MEWTDEAVVLSSRRHGENAAIVQLLTRERGRHAGLVRGGAGRRARGVLQPGNRVSAVWRARLAEHLGTLTCELVHGGAAGLLDDPLRLAALTSAAAVVEGALPEREPHRAIYDGFRAFLDALEADGPPAGWGEVYVRLELGILQELGFGLDLGRCAATGVNDGLAYVSPRTGRAVSLSAGEPYRDRLLPLPGFLVGEGEAGEPGALAAGLRLTGYFLRRHVFAALHRDVPAARDRFVQRLARALGEEHTNC